LGSLGKKDGEAEECEGKVTTYRAKASSCKTCELRARCTSNKLGRNLTRGPFERYLDRVRAYRATHPYEKALRKRKVWIEPLFAAAKEWHGMRRFRLRRLEKVNIEALLIASGQNVKRLLAFFGGCRPKKLAQAAALHLPEVPPFYSRCQARRYRRGVLRRRRRRRFSTRWTVFDTELNRQLRPAREQVASSHPPSERWSSRKLRGRKKPRLLVLGPLLCWRGQNTPRKDG
jgi:hypothetical protein